MICIVHETMVYIAYQYSRFKGQPGISYRNVEGVIYEPCGGCVIARYGACHA